MLSPDLPYYEAGGEDVLGEVDWVDQVEEDLDLGESHDCRPGEPHHGHGIDA